MFRKFLGFAMISGAGWLLDMTVYVGALQIGARPFIANLLGGVVGASFSFIVSGTRIFDAGKGPVLKRVLWYLVYTALAITLISGLIDATTIIAVHMTEWSPKAMAIIIKVVLTPLILLSNFFMVRWILGSTDKGNLLIEQQDR